MVETAQLRGNLNRPASAGYSSGQITVDILPGYQPANVPFKSYHEIAIKSFTNQGIRPLNLIGLTRLSRAPRSHRIGNAPRGRIYWS